MRQFHMKRGSTFTSTVNIDRLWSYVPEKVYDDAKANSSGPAPVLNMTKLGIFKVLGKGHLPKIPIVVQARYFSKEAELKIREAGGACVLTA